MKGTLRLQDGGWVLETSSGDEVWSGEYPLVQDPDFIDTAAEKLINAELDGIDIDQGRVPEHAATKRTALISVGGKPYTVVDER